MDVNFKLNWEFICEVYIEWILYILLNNCDYLFCNFGYVVLVLDDGWYG